MPQIVYADQGQSRTLDEALETLDEAVWVAVSRSGRLDVTTQARTVWVQMRGNCRIEANEGSFVLQRGEWISFASTSLPRLASTRQGLTVGLVLPHPMPAYRDHLPLIGRGGMAGRDLGIAMRTWKYAALESSSADVSHTRPFLLHLSHSQRDLVRLLSRCPGNSFRTKRSLFETLQTARLYMDGNSNRMVRIPELAMLSGYSTQHLLKTFNCVYETTLKSAASGYRLDRARHLLGSTSLAIAEVGSACGFTCQAAFSRAFRYGFEMTASEYRERALRKKWSASRARLFRQAEIALNKGNQLESK